LVRSGIAGIVLILLVDREEKPERDHQNCSANRPGQCNARHLGLL
jgi:hypothetical protein